MPSGEPVAGTAVDALVALLGSRPGSGAAGAPVLPRAIIVQRREWLLARQLRALVHSSVPILWDRRAGDRRRVAGPVLLDRRRGDRREPPPASWSTLRFVVVRPADRRPLTGSREPRENRVVTGSMVAPWRDAPADRADSPHPS